MKHPVGQTRNGISVYVDLVHSKAAPHIASHPYLLGLAKEVVQQLNARGPEITVTYDMGRNVGYDFVVDTTDKDTVLYAQVLRENIYTRFVKNGQPLATRHLTVVLHRGEDGTYELHDVWAGHISPPRPGSLKETPESKPYWEHHAFILAAQQLQLRTVTKVRPY
jgi:hypothetical protein